MLSHLNVVKTDHVTELQIRGGIEDNSRYFFLFLNKTIWCDPL